MQAELELSALEIHGRRPGHSDDVRPLKRRTRPRRADDLRLQTLAEIAALLLESGKRARIIVDSSLKVVLANEAAQHAFATSQLLNLRGSKLHCIHKKLESELSCVLAGATPQTSFSIRVDGRSETVLIRLLDVRGSATSHALIDVSIAAELHLREQFGLTHAEADIARAIFHGLSLVKIAKERCASINTVKTQVRYIFQKVGVRSKVSLARRIGELV
jgi:DNA-binding CsgD family transcriptional regulator